LERPQTARVKESKSPSSSNDENKSEKLTAATVTKEAVVKAAFGMRKPTQAVVSSTKKLETASESGETPKTNGTVAAKPGLKAPSGLQRPTTAASSKPAPTPAADTAATEPPSPAEKKEKAPALAR